MGDEGEKVSQEEARKRANTVCVQIVEELDMMALSVKNTNNCIEFIAVALRQMERETFEKAAKAVNGLVGKDSGNWNRAIIFAVAAIRQQAKEGA